jgi:hypothetical protein
VLRVRFVPDSLSDYEDHMTVLCESGKVMVVVVVVDDG